MYQLDNFSNQKNTTFVYIGVILLVEIVYADMNTKKRHAS